MRNILVVCVGNVCRSPVGERLLQKKLPHCNVSSAGIGALEGHAADKTAEAVAAAGGVSLEGHQGRQFTDEIGAGSDVILVMEAGHKEYFLRKFPQHSGKVMLIDCWGGKQDIPDPYQKTEQFHSLVFGMLETATDAWAKKLGNRAPAR